MRIGDENASVPIEGTRAMDTVLLGAEVTYMLEYVDCPASQLRVTAAEPATITASWAGERRLILDFSRPMGAGSGRGRFTFYGVTDRPGESSGEASTVEALRGGTQLMLAAPAITDYFGLIIDGIWDGGGLPIGGSAPLDLRLPVILPSLPPLVVREVVYRENPPEIHVGLNRPLESACPFVLEPGSIELVPLGNGSELVLPLDQSLATGNYTLTPSAGCSQTFSGLGMGRGFRVGFRFYPNPIRAGGPLILENLSTGTVVEILDTAGRRLATRVSEAALVTLDLDLAPGLYFVRTAEPGHPVRVEKLAIIR
jgi:hypothetical protein